MARSDEEIGKDVTEHLNDDSCLDASEIKVEVHGGKVKLSGTVSTYVSLSRAIKDAWSVSGVNRVRDEMVIRHPRNPGQ